MWMSDEKEKIKQENKTIHYNKNMFNLFKFYNLKFFVPTDLM